MVKNLRHAVREADAAVGGGVAGKIAFVHASRASDAHEKGHWGCHKYCAGRAGMPAQVYVTLQGRAILVDVFAEQGGFVIDVLFDDAEIASSGGHAFTT